MFINHHNGVPSRSQGARNAPGLLLAVSPVLSRRWLFQAIPLPVFDAICFVPPVSRPWFLVIYTGLGTSKRAPAEIDGAQPGVFAVAEPNLSFRFTIANNGEPSTRGQQNKVANQYWRPSPLVAFLGITCTQRRLTP